MSYKGIIFDFNGTLVWDTPLHKEAWLRYSVELGCPFTEKQYYNNMHGKSTKDILKFLLKREIGETEMRELSDRKEVLYRRSCLENPEIYRLAPGVEDFLDFTAGASIPRTIATASGIDNVDFYIETLGLEKWFDPELIVYDDGSFACKPSPEIYIEASKRLCISPQELIIVEDTYFGALSAKKAGAGRLIVTGPPKDQHDELGELEGIDLFISDFAEIDRSLFCLSCA